MTLHMMTSKLSSREKILDNRAPVQVSNKSFPVFVAVYGSFTPSERESKCDFAFARMAL